MLCDSGSSTKPLEAQPNDNKIKRDERTPEKYPKTKSTKSTRKRKR